MQVDIKSGTIVTAVVLAILVASLLGPGLVNRDRPSQNVTSPAIGRAVPPPVLGAPYYVRVTLDKSFTQELYFAADGEQHIGYRVNGTNWLVDIVSYRKTDTSVQVSVHAERYRKEGATGSMSSLGVNFPMTVDASPQTYPQPSYLPPRKENLQFSKVQMPICTVSVHSKPTIVKPVGSMVMR